MECGAKFVKILLFVFNFVFVVCGLALVCLGALAMTIYKDNSAMLDSSYSAGPIAVIVAGVVIFVVAFLGCCGAIQESRVMLIIFGVCLLVLLVVQVILAITIYVKRSTVGEALDKSLTKEFNNYRTSNSSRLFVDKSQQLFKCCGFNGTADWGSNIPSSCCTNNNSPCNTTLAYPTGCKQAIVAKVKSQVGIVAGVALGVCLVEIIGMTLAFFLSRAIAHEYEKV